MRNVFPLRPKPLQQPCGYAAGWCDGCKYGEGLARWKGRLEGAFAGVLVAVVIVATVIYFGGGIS